MIYYLNIDSLTTKSISFIDNPKVEVHSGLAELIFSLLPFGYGMYNAPLNILDDFNSNAR